MYTQASTIWRFRHFWMSLVHLDLRLRYRRSVLGVGWSLLNPLMMTVVFCVVFSKMMGFANWTEAAPQYLAGLAIWEYISLSAILGCQTFLRNESYIRQCPLPLAVYTLRSVLGSTIHFGIALGVSVLAIAALNPSHWSYPLQTLWMVVPALVLLVLFCWSISVIAAFLNVHFQDTQQLAEVFFRILFFMTPILYAPAKLKEEGLNFLLDYSPIVVFFDLIRVPLTTGQAPEAVAMVFGKALLFVAVFGGIALAMISKLEKKLIFHL